MSRRGWVVSALVVQALVVLAAAADAPFATRLPLGLVYACAVPGFAVVGLLRLRDPLAELTLSIVLSLTLGIAAAQLLVWSGHYSLKATLALLGAVTIAGLAGQLAFPTTSASSTTGADSP